MFLNAKISLRLKNIAILAFTNHYPVIRVIFEAEVPLWWPDTYPLHPSIASITDQRTPPLASPSSPILATMPHAALWAEVVLTDLISVPLRQRRSSEGSSDQLILRHRLRARREHHSPLGPSRCTVMLSDSYFTIPDGSLFINGTLVGHDAHLGSLGRKGLIAWWQEGWAEEKEDKSKKGDEKWKGRELC